MVDSPARRPTAVVVRVSPVQEWKELGPPAFALPVSPVTYGLAVAFLLGIGTVWVAV